MSPTKKTIAILAVGMAIRNTILKQYNNHVPYVVHKMLSKIDAASEMAMALYPVKITQNDIKKMADDLHAVTGTDEIDIATHCGYMIAVLNDILLHVKNEKRRAALEDVQNAVQKIANYMDPKQRKEDEYSTGLEMAGKFQEVFL